MAVGVALTAAVFALVIGKEAPGIAFSLTLIAGILILFVAFQNISRIIEVLCELLAAADLERSLFLPVIKTVGIAVTVRIAAALCRDAGQSSLAAKLELTGAVAAIAVSLPLFQRVLDMVSSMLA